MESVYQTPAQVAKAARIELKAKFPGIKFSVTSKSYSGGNSLNVSWTLGPTTKAVDAVISKYQYGSFDGMTDSYNYDETLVSMPDGEVKVLGGCKFVFANREIPEAIYDRAMRELCALQGVEFKGRDTNIYGEGAQWTRESEVSSAIYRILYQKDLTKGYNGLTRSDCKCGNIDEMYEVVPC